MILYSMTATFGKLEHETLTLHPGLNVIEAPNEWGKSTWCAFLISMLYGIDTRAKTTKTALADKERYAPWSGAPMAGRIDLNWNGRDITIERRTKGRLIFGDFRAYETASGLDVSELNSANCGQTLLGVERSVFARAGFLKLTDLPVTQDDSLRRRLNNLVTTGDESGAGDQLAQKLKDLKNKCRYNRSGLLPQAEEQRDMLQNRLYDLQDLSSQIEKAKNRQQELERWISQLENHKTALAYAAAQADAQQVRTAEADWKQAQAAVSQLEAQCQALPSQAEVTRSLQVLQNLREQQMALHMEKEMLPPPPEKEDVPHRFENAAPEEAVTAAQADAAAYENARAGQKKSRLFMRISGILAIVLALGLIGVYFLTGQKQLPLFFGGIGILAVGGISALLLGRNAAAWQAGMTQLLAQRAPILPENWVADAENFAQKQAQYQTVLQEYQAAVNAVSQRQAALDQQITQLTDGQTLPQRIDAWNAILEQWNALGDARRDLQRSQSHYEAISAMAKHPIPPKFPDSLDYPLSETDAMLTNALLEQRQNQHRLGQLQGQADSLGQEETLRAQLRQVKQRIERLEDTYRALELAQNALSAATNELQRRFAPRISKRTQALFGKLTGNRYDRLTLRDDLSLQVGAQEEDTLHSAQWRSDGTVDQLYLALRLAVAEELTPEAPLILDDALVRFDDQRLAAAMEILKEAAQTKQVILFTCQSREKAYLE